MEFSKFSDCALYFVVFGLLVAWVLQIILLIVVKLGDVKDEIIKKIFPEKSETPLYALEFDTIKPKDDKNYIESFYEFKGREDIKQENNETSINITKIYQHYFIYKKDERTYLDYLQNFTVKSGENCKENYKQCGIFNSEGRILCLPNEEECPLNDFGISNNSLDSNYDNNYKNYEVSDISKIKHIIFIIQIKI